MPYTIEQHNHDFALRHLSCLQPEERLNGLDKDVIKKYLEKLETKQANQETERLKKQSRH